MPNPIYILNGPNLNLLGQRQPEIYGHQTLDDVKALCVSICKDAGYGCEFRQTNIEGELVEHIHDARANASALVINPAAYTHTSVALFDALSTLEIPVVEVHLSQPAARESFRQISYAGQASTGTVSGFGINSYLLGIKAAILSLDK